MADEHDALTDERQASGDEHEPPGGTPEAAEQALGRLPQALAAPLEAMTAQLVEGLGDALISALVYGSAARPEDWDAQASDVDVMIVLDRVTLDTLDQVRPALAIARRAAPVDALVLTPDDLRSSADAFPLRFLDIARTHVVLHGVDPMRELDIAWDHLRLRVEQEIKGLMFSLRREYLLHARRPEVLARVLSASLSTFFAGVGALLYLSDPQWWISGKEAVARAASAHLDYDEALMRRLLQLYRGELHPNEAQLRLLYAHTMQLVERAAERVDRLEQGE